MKKNKNILIILVVVFIALFVILVVLPDSFFNKKSGQGINEITTENSDEFPFRNFSDMWNLINNEVYSYEYEVLIGTNLYNYIGTKNKDKDKGFFTSNIVANEYTEINDYINHNFIDTTYIRSITKGIEPKKFNYDDYRMYTYNLQIDNIDTEIIIYTDLKNITKIVISNPYFQYNLKYSNIIGS